MSKVADILREKGAEVFTIGDVATVFEAVVEMESKGVGCLVVMRGETIRGIVTERDYLRKIIVKGRSSKSTSVSDIMSSNIVVASPQDSVQTCMVVMTETRIRHLPVIDSGALVGLVSVGDLVKQMTKDQKAEIKYLTDYITGKYPG
jgi:CBS domain-containing protein